MKRIALTTLTLVLPLLAACGGGGASEPYITSVNPVASNRLQFAVGVATISYNGGQSTARGLNTVATLRQPNGLSGVLYSVPQIVGPSSFVIGTSTETQRPVQSAGSDAGTNHITWGTLNQTLWTGQPRGIAGATTGVFGYGFCPCNADAGPVTGTPNLYQAFNLPVYGNTNALYYGGPPAFPRVDASVAALGFEGYSLGFTDFAVAPALGGYTLSVALPPNFTGPGTPTPTPQPGTATPPPAPVLTATSVLAASAGLAQFPTPAFTADGAGGGAIALNVPRGTYEAIVFVRAVGGSGSGDCRASHATDQFYTLVTHQRGKIVLQLPDALGETSSGTSTPTICPNESYAVYAAGFNYGAYEAAYPQNLSITPPIAGSNGQADVTTSDVLSGAYPS